VCKKIVIAINRLFDEGQNLFMSKIAGIFIKTGMHPGVQWWENYYNPQEQSQNIVLKNCIKSRFYVSLSAGRCTTKKYQSYYGKFFCIRLCKNCQNL